MNPQLRKISRGLAISLVLVVVAVVGIKRAMRPKTYAEIETERIAKITKQDKSVLGNSKAHEADIYGALIRLSSRGDETARREALNRVLDPSTLVRAGAANGLGYFDDPEVLKSLEKLATDPDIQVRVQALNGISHRTGVGRIEALKRVAMLPSATPEEVIAAWSGVLTLATDPVQKASALDTLVGLSTSSRVSENIRNLAALKVISLSPRDEKVVKLMREIVVSGKNRALMPISLRHLSTMGQPGLGDIFLSAVRHEDLQVRIAAFQGLRFSCHPKRYEVAETVIRNDRELVVREAVIRELQWMPSQRGIELLERVIQDHSLKDEQERLAKIAIVEIRRVKDQMGSQPCK